MAARDETTGGGRGGQHTAHSHTTETKASFKTSEFAAYIVVFIGILIAANVIEDEGGESYTQMLWTGVRTKAAYLPG